MSFLPNPTLIVDALGWAVLHSLWQGALAGLAVWALRALTKENAADTRYMAGMVVLSALFAAFIGTFLYYFNVGASVLASVQVPTQIITIEATGALLAAPLNPLLHITHYTDIIGMLWALCFTVLSVRYLAAFRLTHKLRTTGTSFLPWNEKVDWNARFIALAKQSGVNNKVRCFISEHVASPVTFGFLKPIVLVPAWFFSGMTTEQCEAVLLHELAHIRRHDYLTNIFQIIIKTVFFYHPAVRYICDNINTDREHACDDFAVNLTRNPEHLAVALGTIRIKAARNAGVYAQIGILGADGPDAPIMHRLKRLVGAPTNGLRANGTAGGFAATGMMVIASGLIIALGATQSQAKTLSTDPLVQENELAGAKIKDKRKEKHKNTQMSYMLRNGQIYKIKNGKKYLAGTSDISLQNGKKTIGVHGENFKITDNKFYIKTQNGYSKGTPLQKDYKYSFITKNGKTYAVKTSRHNNSFIQIKGSWFSAADKPEFNIWTPKTPKPPVVRAASSRATAQPMPPRVPQTIAHNTITLNGVTYKTKFKPRKNTTFIKVDDKWHDMDETDLDALIPNIDGDAHGRLLGHAIANRVTAQVLNDVQLNLNTQTSHNQHKYDKKQAKHDRKWAEKNAEHQREMAQEQVEWAQEQKERALAFEEEHRQRAEENVREQAEWQRENTQKQREWAQEYAEEQRELGQEMDEERKEHARRYAEERRESAREFSEEHKEFAREFAEEQRESAQEYAEEKREREAERKEEQLERAEERRERAQEHAEERRERAEERRDREHEKNDKKRADKQRVKYEKMRAQLIPALLSDGYIKSKNEKVVIDKTNEYISINGVKISNHSKDQYCKIFTNGLGDTHGGLQRIVLKPDYLHVSKQNKNGQQNYTHSSNSQHIEHKTND